MSDPDGEIFEGLLNEIEIYDVKGDRLTFQRDSNQRNSKTGYFYLDPDPDFTPRPNSLDDTRFEFELIAVDWRGLISSQEIIFEAYATPPTLDYTDFQSEVNSVTTVNTVEWKDPLNELDDWIQFNPSSPTYFAIKAIRFPYGSEGTNLSDSVEVSYLSSPNLPLDEIADHVGTHKLEFKIKDPRISLNPAWQDELSVSKEIDIIVESHKPVVSINEVVYSNESDSLNLNYRLRDPELEFKDWNDTIEVSSVALGTQSIFLDINRMKVSSL